MRNTFLKRWLGVAGVIVFYLTLNGCSCDRNQTKIQYMPDMADGPLLKPQRTYIDPPEGSVSRQAILYPKTAEEAETVLTSPYAGTNQTASIPSHHLEEGKRLFETFCAVCHGHDAKGHGPVADKLPPPDLTMDVYKQRADGYFFYRITFGGLALMPSYGHAISPDERWKIVGYLRTLQSKSKG